MEDQLWRHSWSRGTMQLQLPWVIQGDQFWGTCYSMTVHKRLKAINFSCMHGVAKFLHHIIAEYTWPIYVEECNLSSDYLLAGPTMFVCDWLVEMLLVIFLIAINHLMYLWCSLLHQALCFSSSTDGFSQGGI